ncbi:HAD family hydrolase [Rapidithrix thailandica]|uniref:HAD family hydrolase n=1 Tax=Rapidithrix thailandica TaxID=413964 RepID=A0AAW9RZQ3_9BACT
MKSSYIKNRKLVILDLDETLIHATDEPQNEDWDFEFDKYKVYKRPGLDYFLVELHKHFDVAVWSSATDDYVKEIVRNIFPAKYELKFVWGRSKCALQYNLHTLEYWGYLDNHLNYVKILKKVKKRGFAPLEQMLIIDDTPHKARYNYGNAIYPEEFNGEKDDRELELLLQYLLTIKDVDNVRTIEKRNWKE